MRGSLLVVAWLHLDCHSGLSGDMFLGACLDLGMPLEVLEGAVARLGLKGVRLEAREAARGGLRGTRLRVLERGIALEGPEPDEGERRERGAGSKRLSEARVSRSYRQQARRIEESALDAVVKGRALSLLRRLSHFLAAGEGVSPDEVRFPGIHAVDSLVDVVGVAAALEHLRPTGASCGAVNVGSAGPWSSGPPWGRLPLETKLRSFPLFAGGDGELLTPTGAAILEELVREVSEVPPLEAEATGHGLGLRELTRQPNVVRLLVGRPWSTRDRPVTLFAFQAPDATPSAGWELMERLLGKGILDGYLWPLSVAEGGWAAKVWALEERAPEVEREIHRRGVAVSLGSAAEFLAPPLSWDGRPVATPWGKVATRCPQSADETTWRLPEVAGCRRLGAHREVPAAAVFAFAGSVLRAESPAG